MIYGGIEAGGTKWVCAVGSDPGEVQETISFATTTPDETLARAAAFFAGHGELAAIGVGCFGPLDLRAGSPTWGRITTTPKPGWSGTNVAGALRGALGVPIAIDTDVNAAALAEHRWGSAFGLGTFCYITVGTGIGGGGLVNGELMHGLIHPDSATCACRMTASAIRSEAHARTTATASRDSRRAARCSPAGACRPRT